MRAEAGVAIAGKSPYIAAMHLSLAPFDAVIFDMDGTLLDTELVFRHIVFEVAHDLGYPMTDPLHLSMVGSSHETTNRLLVEAYGASFPYALFDERCRTLMKARLVESVPIKRLNAVMWISLFTTSNQSL